MSAQPQVRQLGQRAFDVSNLFLAPGRRTYLDAHGSQHALQDLIQRPT